MAFVFTHLLLSQVDFACCMSDDILWTTNTLALQQFSQMIVAEKLDNFKVCHISMFPDHYQIG